MKILTIHGIRRTERWYATLKNLDFVKQHKIEVINYEYGYFTTWQFLTPWHRNKVYTDFQKFYSENFTPTDPPNIICHSFGTYVFFSAISKYTSIRFNKVILCGAILNTKIKWDIFFERGQVLELFNDYGRKDWIVPFSRPFLWKAGWAGKSGFKIIPAKYADKFIQEKNDYITHSDYFLPTHMIENWIKRFISNTNSEKQKDITKQTKAFKYDKDILRPQILQRITTNYLNDENVKYKECSYYARIDNKGNYYATYSKKGTPQDMLSELDIITTADATHNNDEMDFQAYDENKKTLEVSSKIDTIQHKRFTIHFDTAIPKNEEFRVWYKFMWHRTINLKSGDTDHFVITGCEKAIISLNFPGTLKSARFYIISNGIITEHCLANVNTEKDGSRTYYIDYNNVNNYDGIIFYFEGIGNIVSQRNARIIRLENRVSDMEILKCTDSDIKKVYRIETEIEFSNAASEETLKDRLSMFNDGFLVAKINNQVVGYIESVIMNDWDFQRFNDIKNFPLHFNPNGDTLYVIFLAVDSKFRGKKIGLALLENLENVAIQYGINKIKLVAKDTLTDYYVTKGFSIDKELPNFLPNSKTKSTVMYKYL